MATQGHGEAEVLTAGPDGAARVPLWSRLAGRPGGGRWSRRPGPRVVVLLALLAALVAGGVGDRRARTAEFGELLARCSAAHAQVGWEQDRLSSVVAYATPLLQRPTGPPGVPEGVALMVRRAAAQAAGDLAGTPATVSAVSVLPWHATLAAARGACAQYLQLVVDRFTAIGQDLAAAYRPQTASAERLQRTRNLLAAAAPDDAARRAVSSRLADAAR